MDTFSVVADVYPMIVAVVNGRKVVVPARELFEGVFLVGILRSARTASIAW